MINFRKTTLAIVAFACLAGTALAQPGPNGGRGPDRNDRNDRHERVERMQQAPGHRDMRHDDRRADRHDVPQPHAQWRRGGRVPSEYRGNNYVVDDWRGHQLKQPPRGYHWVGVGGDYVLAAIAGGVIAQIITGR